MKNSPLKRLSALTANINIIISGNSDPVISGIAYDSRLVKPGHLFIALPGIHVDGHNFIDRAIAAGAAAVLYSDPEKDTEFEDRNDAVFVRTTNTRTAMAAIAAAFYDKPSEKLTTIGVTGTDGKTSTVYFLDQLLELCGLKSGFISTAACKSGALIEKNPYRQSTPEAVEINMMLFQMIGNAKTHTVIETTSHGLSKKNNRLGEIKFDAAVFTNLSHEHLEFHGTLEQYRDDKANLFRKLKPTGFGVVNLDDSNAQYFIDEAPVRVYTCSLKESSADFFADKINTSSDGSSFRININAEASADGVPHTIKTSIKLPGLFNIENALESFAAVYRLTGNSPEKISELLPKLSAVKGRMKVINCGQPFTVIVDYAHTPGAFLRLFPDMRKQTCGRLIAVFGSAGERDVDKRPEQGQIAAEYADILVLTDEDPRGEDGMTIIKEIAAGAMKAPRGVMLPLQNNKNLLLVPDRRAAISKAFALAGADDTVILLGKGHESSIIYADGPIPWDEQAVAEEVLRESN